MKQDLSAVLAQAAGFYRKQLRASSRAIGYLKGRGMRGETAARFGVGYAPAGAQELRHVFLEYEADELVTSGLVVKHETGRRYDRFRDRIMVPILDEHGVVVGFGGRILDGGQPKYLNSPESPVFQKGRILFGLPQALESIRQTDAVHVVEGYLDVLSLAQAGLSNAVATLGTATTTHHAQKLLDLAKRVVFCFDGDETGRKAAERAMHECLPWITDEADVSFLFLPGGHDPDSYVSTRGAESFLNLAQEASSLEGFFMACMLSGLSLEYAEGRAALVSRATHGLQQLRAPAVRSRLIGAVAHYSQLSVADVASVCGL